MRGSTRFMFLVMFALTLVGWYAHYVAAPYLADSIRFLILFFTLTLSVALVIWLIAFAWVALEKARTASERRLEARATRRIIEAEASKVQAEASKVEAEALKLVREAEIFATITKPGELLHITHAGDRQTQTVIPTLAGTSHVNGIQVEPAEGELRRWQFFHTLANAHGRVNQLEAPPAHPLIEGPAVLPDEVRLRDHLPGQPSVNELFLGVGKFPDGQIKPVRMGLMKLTHIAVAGSSGFGKSTGLQCLAYQMLHARENVAVVLLDAQGVTFSLFDNHASLLYPVVRKPQDILAVLMALGQEMQLREELFNRWSGVMDLATYNQVADKPLPIIGFIFDEFGLVADVKEIVACVKQLSAGGRKLGMYGCFSAQTWNASEITTAIRSNLATTIHYYARDKAQSRVLLGDSCAAEITRPGEAYASLPGVAGLVQMQTPIYDEPFTPVLRDPTQMTQAVPEIAVEPTEAEQEDQAFVELVRGGMSRRRAAMTAYGKPYSGDTVSRGKRALGEI